MSLKVENFIEKLLKPEPEILELRELRELCKLATEIFLEESNV